MWMPGRIKSAVEENRRAGEREGERRRAPEAGCVGRGEERKRGRGSFEWVILHLAHPPTPPYKSWAQQLCLIRRIVLPATGSLYTSAHRSACRVYARIRTWSRARSLRPSLFLSFLRATNPVFLFTTSEYPGATKFSLNHWKLYYNATGERTTMRQRLGQVALCQSRSGGGYDFNEKESRRLRTIDEGPKSRISHFVNGKMTLTNWFVMEKWETQEDKNSETKEVLNLNIEICKN